MPNPETFRERENEAIFVCSQAVIVSGGVLS